MRSSIIPKLRKLSTSNAAVLRCSYARHPKVTIGARLPHFSVLDRADGINHVRCFSNDTHTSPKKGRVKPWLDRDRSTASRIKELLEASRTLHPADFHSKEMLDLVIKCCQKNTLEGMQQAQDIIDRLVVEKRKHKAKGVQVTIPEKIWQKTMYGWAVLTPKLPVARFRMKELLQMAIEEAKYDMDTIEEGEIEVPSVEPTVQVHLFNTYLQGLANAAKISSPAALDAEASLYDMMELHHTFGWLTKPNTRSYTYVINAYANNGHPDAGERALTVLRHMQQAQAAQKHAYQEEHGIPYDFANPDVNKSRIVVTDAVAYTATMKAILRSRSPPREAVDLFQEMLQDPFAQVNEAVFTMAIRALGKKVDILSRNKKRRIETAALAEEILWMMVEYAKNEMKTWDTLAGFNAALDAWSRTFYRDAAPNTEALLRKMLESGDVKPDSVSFNSCLFAWSRSSKFHPDAAQRAEQLLAFQHELCSSGVLSDKAMPDFQSYTITILAHANSKDPQKTVHARAVLENLLTLVKNGQVKVDRNPAAPFSAVLSAAARSSPSTNESVGDGDVFTSEVDSKEDAYSIALQTYRELSEDFYGLGASPDHHAYASFLKCIAQHCAEDSAERSTMAQTVFEDACKAGQVSRLVLEAAKILKGLPIDKDATKVADLPRFWWRNVERKWQH